MLLLETRTALIVLSAVVVFAYAASQPSSPSQEDVITQLKVMIHKQQEDFQQFADEVRVSIQQLKAELENERAEKGRCHCPQDDHGTDKNKRADDADPLTVVVSQVSQRLDDVTAETETLKARVQTLGSVYVRWGHSACAGSSQLVYSGVIGGSHYSHSGGATNPLCLPTDPVYSTSSQGTSIQNGYAALYGAEYEIIPEASYNLDAVCAVCRPPRATTLMIPATTSCQSGWTLEYTGYIMADLPDDGRSGTEFICVDSEMQGRAGSQGSNNDQMVLYYTKNHCGSLPCPPYEESRVVSCVVCSK